MKRNESILVYSVTGLLVVILAVAILFGNEHGVQAQIQPRGKPLDELVGVSPAAGEAADTGAKLALADGVKPSADFGSPGADFGSPGADFGSPRADFGSKVESAKLELGPGKLEGDAAGATNEQRSPASPTAKDAAAGSGVTSTIVNEAPVSAPLLAQSALGKEPAHGKEVTPQDLATQVLMWLGDSKRDGKYRVVTVRKGDTFSELVQRWCGGLDQLEVAESLNEELNLQRLEQGAKVCLPWVDDDKLVAGHMARKQKQDGEFKLVAEARDKGQTYTVKSGDKLWNIATQRVGQKNAAKFIEEVKALNPELLADPSKLVVGKTILLPR